MESLHNLYQRPLLVTEFAPADWSATTVAGHKLTEESVLAFMKQALPWLETTTWRTVSLAQQLQW
jgi:Glycosyl hydrolase catalytic core